MLETAHVCSTAECHMVVMFQVLCLCFGTNLRGGHEQCPARARPLNARDYVDAVESAESEREPAARVFGSKRLTCNLQP
jgi:hypothetical protein